MPSRHLAVTAAAVSAVVLTAGCASSGENSVAPTVDSSTTAAPVAPVTDDDVLGLWGVGADFSGDSTQPWIRIDHDGRFVGDDGCNAVSGRWTLVGSSGTVAVDVKMMTLVACAGRPPVLLDRLTVVSTGLSFERQGGRPGVMRASARPEVPMFLIESSGNALAPVPAPLPPTVRVRTPNERALAGVEALLDAKESGRRFSSLWGRICGLGTGVESIDRSSAGDAVVVRLTGQGGAVCDLSSRGFELRRQQLAWTVVTDLGVPATTTVRVLGPSGERLYDDTVPDPAYLAP